DLEWFRQHASTTCDVVDISDETSLIAVQGPKAVGIVNKLGDGTLADMPSFTFRDTTIAGVPCMVARTGYTGEDGFEIACRNEDATKLWGALLDAATPVGGLPVGLGARDSLRLEAKLPLYGNDIDEEHTPLEAGLGWAVKLDKGDFFGASVLREQKAKGLTRQLVGFKLDDSARAIPRHGYPILDRTAAVPDLVDLGVVTSGGPAIYVGGAIGLGYVPSKYAAPGTQLTIDCRGKDATATVVSGKFYKRPQ
ncbi:MAG TPA: glycine cleavage T C-terminal barrel domain-containing protein, partial [Kofleriaceae bacterium]